jgi:hypothetical protein
LRRLEARGQVWTHQIAFANINQIWHEGVLRTGADGDTSTLVLN